MGKKKKGTGRSPKQVEFERHFERYMNSKLFTQEEIEEYTNTFEEKKRLQVKFRDDALREICRELYIEIDKRHKAEAAMKVHSFWWPIIFGEEKLYFTDKLEIMK